MQARTYIHTHAPTQNPFEAGTFSEHVVGPLQVGTFAWAAPEVLLGQPCSEKVDIYSYGVLLWCAFLEPT